MRAVVCVFACASLFSCAARPKESTHTASRVDAMERNIAKLEARIVELEKSAQLMDTVMQGVGQIIERLDQLQLTGGGGPPRPDPGEIYAVPVEGNAYMGPANAKVTMVKAFDFYCGYCNQIRPTLMQLRKEYKDDLKIVFKHFVIHEDIARLPALAACAAHKQGKFFPMFDAIWSSGFESQEELEESDLTKIAKGLGLKMSRFKEDMYGRCEAEVREDQRALSRVGTRGTPAFYINGRFLSGARAIEEYRALIDEEIAKANRTIGQGVSVEGYYDHIQSMAKQTL